MLWLAKGSEIPRTQGGTYSANKPIRQPLASWQHCFISPIPQSASPTTTVLDGDTKVSKDGSTAQIHTALGSPSKSSCCLGTSHPSASCAFCSQAKLQLLICCLPISPCRINVSLLFTNSWSATGCYFGASMNHLHSLLGIALYSPIWLLSLLLCLKSRWHWDAFPSLIEELYVIQKKHGKQTHFASN